MRYVKTNLLALAVTVAPLAGHAELRPLEEAAMGGITGQAGVTIELETKINVDEFIYTDEGSLGVSDVFVGGAGRDDMLAELGFNIPSEATDLLDNFKVVIDVEDDGDANIRVLPLYGSPVDFAVRTGAWELRANNGSGDSTVVMDNLSVEGMLGSFQAHLDTATDKLNINTRFAIDDLDVDVPFLAVGIRDLRVTGAGYDDNQNVVTAFAQLDMDIYNGARADGGESLAIDIGAFDADVMIGGILIGGTSIGSVKLDNLSVTNTAMRVYGHQ